MIVSDRIDLDALRAAVKGREPDLIASLLPHGIRRGIEWWTLNPLRDDEHLGSFSICLEGERAGCWHDFASGQSGDLFHLIQGMSGRSFIDSARYVARFIGLRADAPELEFKAQDAAKIAEWKKRQANGTAFGKGCRLQDLAEVKHLPVEWLRGLGLREHDGWPERGDHPAMPCHVEIPYLDRSGKRVGLRRRSDIRAKAGSTWKTGSALIPYGLHRFDDTETSLVIVEGESDCWCLWHAGIAAIGLPGAGTWKDEWAGLLPATASLYLVREPDEAGGELAKKLAVSPIAPRVKVLALPAKDPADLWVQTKEVDMFRATIAAARTSAKPLVSAPRLTVLRHADRVNAFTIQPPGVIAGVLPVGGVGAIVAMPGIGKSIVALELARCVAAGEPLAGKHATTSGRVLYVCPDSPTSTQRRMLAVDGHVAENILSVGDLPKRLPDDIDALTAVVTEANATEASNPIRMIVLDTWDSSRRHASGGYSEQDASAEEIMAALRRLATDLRLAIVVVHHATRQDGGRARGTVVFDARCDWIATVEAVGTSVLLTTTKSRDGERGTVGSWMIESRPVGNGTVPVLIAQSPEQAKKAADEARLMDVLRAVVALAKNGDETSRRHVAKTAGVSHGNQLTRYVERLRERGLLTPTDPLTATKEGARTVDDEWGLMTEPGSGSQTPPVQSPVHPEPRFSGAGSDDVSPSNGQVNHGSAALVRVQSEPAAPRYTGAAPVQDDVSESRPDRRKRIEAKPSDAEDLFADPAPKPKRKGSL